MNDYLSPCSIGDLTTGSVFKIKSPCMLLACKGYVEFVYKILNQA